MAASAAPLGAVGGSVLGFERGGELDMLFDAFGEPA